MTLKKDKPSKPSTTRGPSLGYSDSFPKRELWKEIAREFNGEFKINHNSGNELEIHTILIPYKNWNIIISISDSRPLKIRISFLSIQDFELMLSWEDFIERIITKFSKSKIELGWQEFDKRYLIKSNRSDLVKKIITKEIQKKLIKHNIYSISYKTDLKTGMAELISFIQKEAGNKEKMIEIIELYKTLVDNLEKIRIIK